MSQMNPNPPQNRDNTRWVEVVAVLRRMLLNNWQLKVLSLLLSLALWAGLITQDPTLTREKTFRDVKVSVNNSDILRRNGYVVVTDLDALLQEVTVTAEVPQMKYGDATAANYNIRVDLSRLEAREGTQELTILTTTNSTYGTVTRVNPPTITVEVEEYVTHSNIPVNVVEVGQVPEGFYAAGVTRDPSWVTVSGPRSLVERVDRAQVILNMSELPAREGTVERALVVTLVDAQGNPVESDMLQVTRESVLRERVTVTVNLYTRRDVNVLDAQLYTGQPAEGYEVTDVYVTPGSVTVAGLQNVLDSVTLVQPNRLADISGATENVTATVELVRPTGLQWMSASKVSLTVVIQPVQQTVQWTDVPVQLTGVSEGLTGLMSHENAVVRVTGPADVLATLAARDVVLCCDATGLSAGVHEVTLQCELPGDVQNQGLVEVEPMTVTLTLTAAN